MVGVTTHAKRRLKERCGVNKQSAIRMAERAFNKGISFDNASTAIKQYISSVYLCHDKMCNNIRIYGDMVYIFDNQTLITVYPIPQYLKDSMEDYAVSIDEAIKSRNEKYKLQRNYKVLRVNCKDKQNITEIFLRNIRIDGYLKNGIPKGEKSISHAAYFERYGKIEKPILVNTAGFLVDGYIDYLLAKGNGYDKIECIIVENDSLSKVYEKRRKERYELIQKQDRKCYHCGSKISQYNSELITLDGEKYCICEKCNGWYSSLNNKNEPKDIELKREIEQNFLDENIEVKKIVLNDHIGKCIRITFDKENYGKINNDFIGKISKKYNLRVVCKKKG